MAENNNSATGVLFNAKESKKTTNIFFGQIITVDSIANKATVFNQTEGIDQNIVIDLPTYCSPTGVGMRFVPFPDNVGAHSLKIMDNKNEFFGMGYNNLESKLIDNKDATKDQYNIPLRYLYPGEVSIIAGQGNELFFDKSGGVMLSSGNYDSIFIDGLSGTTNITSSNFKSEFDGVRIRIGNVRRPVDPLTLDEMYLIKDGEIQEKEFMVQVGTEINSEGVAVDKPTVGIIGMGTRIFDEQGRFFKSKDDNLHFLVKTTSGGGIGIDDKGGSCIFDYNTGDTIVLGGEASPEKWIRVGSNSLAITKDRGMGLNHSTGASIEISSDGKVILQESGGNGVFLDVNGVTLNASKASINFLATDLVFSGTMSIGTMPAYTLLRGENVCTMFDTHIHPGPGSPPAVPWTAVLYAQLAALAIKVS